MKYCSKCGYGMADDAAFCQNCGAPAATVTPPEPVVTVPKAVVPETVPETEPVVQPVAEPQYMSRQQQPPVVQYTNVNVQQPAPAQRPAPKPRNGFGVAGFVLALIGIVLAWVPFIGIVGVIFGGLGAIFGLVGLITGIVQKRPIGLSIAALVISTAAIVGGVSMIQNY